MKHIQTRFLWIQERLALKHFVLSKVSTLLNRADYLTKQLSAKEMYGHLYWLQEAGIFWLVTELKLLSEFRTSKDRRDACWS